jgi:hypothetical protein
MVDGTGLLLAKIDRCAFPLRSIASCHMDNLARQKCLAIERLNKGGNAECRIHSHKTTE